jgi:hypothetical protein
MGRIITVGKYLMSIGNEYEKFVFTVRGRSGASPYEFEAIALHGSNFVLNAVLVGLGFSLPQKIASSPATSSFGWDPNVLEAYKIAGLAGVVVTVFLFGAYGIRRDKVDRLAEEFFRQERTSR